MGEIILFTQLLLKRYGAIKMYENIINELQNNTNTDYSISYVENIADKILAESDRANIIGAIPIVKIVEEFGFEPYAIKPFSENESGNIYIGGTTEDEFGRDKIMIVDIHEELYHQRFILAHELAHYLFDYLGNKQYVQNPNILFSAAYLKDGHGRNDYGRERLADRFAAELLMPAKQFLIQFIKIKDIFNNDKDFVVKYLSKCFKTKPSSIIRRIEELDLTL